MIAVHINHLPEHARIAPADLQPGDVIEHRNETYTVNFSNGRKTPLCDVHTYVVLTVGPITWWTGEGAAPTDGRAVTLTTIKSLQLKGTDSAWRTSQNWCVRPAVRYVKTATVEL